MSGADVHTPGKYKAEIAIMWTIVSIPLLYGLYHAVTAALQLFTG